MLLILIASGWTITHEDIEFEDNIDIYLPVSVTVLAFHLVLAAMTYIDIDSSHKYHDYAGV
jgi:hypothetical protein